MPGSGIGLELILLCSLDTCSFIALNIRINNSNYYHACMDYGLTPNSHVELVNQLQRATSPALIQAFILFP